MILNVIMINGMTLNRLYKLWKYQNHSIMESLKRQLKQIKISHSNPTLLH